MVIDNFTISEMTGVKMYVISFTRPVGMGSSLNDLHADLTTKSVISPAGTLIGVKWY